MRFPWCQALSRSTRRDDGAAARNTIERTFSADGFIPRRLCGLWPEWLIREHVGGNALVWLTFIAIPVVIWRLGYRSSGIAPFARLASAFASFVALCGLGHFLDMIAFYHPLYRLSGHVLVATGIASCWTIWELCCAWPALTALRGPRELQDEVNARTGELVAALAQFHALMECIPHIVWTKAARRLCRLV